MKILFSLRIDKEILEYIKRFAKNQSRSTGAQIEYILKQYIQNIKKTK